MNATPGGWLGLVAGLGVLLVVEHLPLRRGRGVRDRVLPYLRDLPGATPAVGPGYGGGGTVARGRSSVGSRLTWLRDVLAGRLDRLLGGADGVRRRLDQVGGGSVQDFRARQVVWSAAGVGAVLGIGLLRVVGGDPPAPVALAVLAAAAGLAGALACDRQLTARAESARGRLLLQLPAAAELLALAVGAGEGPTAALARVARLSTGELGRDLGRVLADVRAGSPMTRALESYADRSEVAAVRRFCDAFAVALERGTPLAGVLRAQAGDARSAARHELTERAARREVLMLLPVVFLVLPVTVLFALFPGFYGLSLTA